MALQSGLDYLRNLQYPFVSVGLDMSTELWTKLAIEITVAFRHSL